MKTIRRREIVIKIAWLTLFSIAMGYLETSVVVYLRQLYYPEGFRFPLAPIDPSIALTEFFREAATVIMLLGMGILSGKTTWQRFAYFIFCFAVWDIFYYVFLKALLGWPSSFFTWDILFIIPVPWVGPVIAPVLVSLSMILFSMAIVFAEEKNKLLRLSKQHVFLLLSGCVFILVSFMQDYFTYASEKTAPWLPGMNEKLFYDISEYIPQYYNWYFFLAGEALLLMGINLFYRKNNLNVIVTPEEWKNGVLPKGTPMEE